MLSTDVTSGLAAAIDRDRLATSEAAYPARRVRAERLRRRRRAIALSALRRKP